MGTYNNVYYSLNILMITLVLQLYNSYIKLQFLSSEILLKFLINLFKNIISSTIHHITSDQQVFAHISLICSILIMVDFMEKSFQMKIFPYVKY